MTKRKPNEKDELVDEYNNRRRWASLDINKNKSLQHGFPQYADRSWTITELKRKIKDIRFFGGRVP